MIACGAALPTPAILAGIDDTQRFSGVVDDLDLTTTAFADVLEAAREADIPRLSATNIADALGLQYRELATLAGVHRNTLRSHPESPRLQAALRDLMRVLSAATVTQPDTERALFMIKNEPIPAFRHKTILQLIEEGRTEDAIDYLESISAGFTG